MTRRRKAMVIRGSLQRVVVMVTPLVDLYDASYKAQCMSTDTTRHDSTQLNSITGSWVTFHILVTLA